MDAKDTRDSASQGVEARGNERPSLGDMTSELVKIVGSSGEVLDVGGGYGITILETVEFPWGTVLDRLLKSLDVWIERREGKIVILSKPKEGFEGVPLP